MTGLVEVLRADVEGQDGALLIQLTLAGPRHGVSVLAARAVVAAFLARLHGMDPDLYLMPAGAVHLDGPDSEN